MTYKIIIKTVKVTEETCTNLEFLKRSKSGRPLKYPLTPPVLLVRKMAAPAAQQPMRGVMKLREMDEKNMHNLFLKNMAGLIEEIKNPSPCTNP